MDKAASPCDPEKRVLSDTRCEWARLDPLEGSEIGKTRPAVIVSIDALNATVRKLTICPITSKLHPRWRTRLQITCSGHPAEMAVDQIRTIARIRIGPLIDTLNRDHAARLRDLISELYADP